VSVVVFPKKNNSTSERSWLTEAVRSYAVHFKRQALLRCNNTKVVYSGRGTAYLLRVVKPFTERWCSVKSLATRDYIQKGTCMYLGQNALLTRNRCRIFAV